MLINFVCQFLEFILFELPFKIPSELWWAVYDIHNNICLIPV